MILRRKIWFKSVDWILINQVPHKLAKLCPPPLFSIHGRFHGSEEVEIEACHWRSWSEMRDYIYLIQLYKALFKVNGKWKARKVQHCWINTLTCERSCDYGLSKRNAEKTGDSDVGGIVMLMALCFPHLVSNNRHQHRCNRKNKMRGM